MLDAEYRRDPVMTCSPINLIDKAEQCARFDDNAQFFAYLMIGRFADRFPIAILIGGQSILATALAVFALFAASPAIGIPAFLVIGLVGVSMNPAMVARVMRTAGPDPLVNTMHASMITAGLALGSWGGGVAIDCGLGLTSPL
jgi:predicted MFS family arabinose efflux permease